MCRVSYLAAEERQRRRTTCADQRERERRHARCVLTSFAIMASKATLVPRHTHAHTPSRLPIQRAPHQPATLRSLLTHRCSSLACLRCSTRPLSHSFPHCSPHTASAAAHFKRARSASSPCLLPLVTLVASTPRRSRRPSRSNPPPPSPPPPPRPHPHPSPRRQTPESSSPPPYAARAWRRQTERRLHSSPP